LRQSMIQDIIVPAQERVRQDADTQAVLAGHVENLVARLEAEARMGTTEVNQTMTVDLVADFVVQWAIKALLDMDIDPQVAALIKTLFLMPSLQIYGLWVEPFASQVSFEDGTKLAAAFDSLVTFVEASPPLQDYVPSANNFFLTKYDYARELAGFFSGAALLGVQHFVLNIFTQLVMPSSSSSTDIDLLLDPQDTHGLGKALLEAARFNPPVKNVNVVLPSDAALPVGVGGGSDKIFPAGTSVMASILLSGFDERVFPDAYSLDVERPNLASNMLTFAALGYDPQYSFDQGRRSCLGQHLVVQAGTDVLAAWLRRQSSSLGSTGASTGNDSVTAAAAAVTTTTPSGGISSTACMTQFAALGFESDNFHLYHRYFRDDSKFIYAAAGVYQGAQAIEEYVAYVSLRNPIFMEKEISFVDVSLKSVDASDGTCTFIIHSAIRYVTDPNFYVESEFMVVAMTKLIYDLRQDYIKEIDLFYTDDFLKFVMARSESRSDHICQVHAACLNKTNDDQSTTHDQCMQKLAALPTYTVDDQGRGYIDGNSYSCRALHSQLAEFDDYHCPHVAFIPTEDPQGAIKCQESAHMLSSDFFDDVDMGEYERYVEKLNAALGPRGEIDPAMGFKVLSLPPEDNDTRSLVAGVIVPILLFLGVYLGLRYVKPEVILASPESRRLWTIGIVWIVVLVSTFGVAALTIFGIGQRNPEWSEWWSHDDPNGFPSLGRHAAPSGTEVQDRLNDDEFYVYVGFIMWVTTLIAGVGMEALVWIYFIRVWSEERERYVGRM
jgi:hypothetical protein